MKKTYYAVFVVVLLFAIAGCATTGTRFSLEPGEGNYNIAHETNKTKEIGFNLLEEWFALNVKNTDKTVKLSNPNTGKLIAQPTIQVPVGMTYFWGHYDLVISVDDNNIDFKFQVGKLENDYWPPKDSMQSIEAKFINIALDITSYINNN